MNMEDSHNKNIADNLPVIQEIEPLIRIIRGRQVMLDRDLAALYGVETKKLNQAVKRNIERFPKDFMFQLDEEEFANWRSQIVTSKIDVNLRCQNDTSNEEKSLRSQFVTSNETSVRGGVRYRPYAFTENGVAMLSSVLRSATAIEVNIRIMRAFTSMRHFLASNAPLFQRLETIEHNQLLTNEHLSRHDRQIEHVLALMEKNDENPKQGIFFDGQIFDAYTFVSDLIRSAENRIVLIDNYVDDSVLAMLDKRKEDVSALIYTPGISRQLRVDLDRHNAQYPEIEIRRYGLAHDRFLIIDDKVYLVGASIKDLGKKLFGFSLLQDSATEDLLNRVDSMSR